MYVCVLVCALPNSAGLVVMLIGVQTGFTPLMHAVSKNKVDVINQLREGGAFVRETSAKVGRDFSSLHETYAPTYFHTLMPSSSFKRLGLGSDYQFHVSLLIVSRSILF